MRHLAHGAPFVLILTIALLAATASETATPDGDPVDWRFLCRSDGDSLTG